MSQGLLAGNAARFDALSTRERYLVFAAAVAVVGFVLHFFFWNPATNEVRRLQANIQQQEQTLAATRAAVLALRGRRVDPDAGTRQRIEQTRLELARLGEELVASTRALVPPERMPQLLERVTARNPSVKIVSLATLEPSPLVDREARKSDAAPGAGKATEAAGIYKHGIELTAQGGYADLARYLARLEAAPLRMYWSRAVLDARAYPQLRLTLTLYTLSQDRSWLRL